MNAAYRNPKEPPLLGIERASPMQRLQEIDDRDVVWIERTVDF
jgi:hypothetical protein